MFRILFHLVLLATSALALATLYVDPQLLRVITREDGPVEWATVLALLTLAGLVARRMLPPAASMPKFHRVVAWGLVVLALLAAGEEISWGQRIFGFETSERMKEINLQQETNLHNLMPVELFNGLIVFALGIGFVLIPMLWRQRSASPPLWLPSPEVSLLMLDALLVNHYVFRSFPEQAGIVVLVALLSWETLRALRNRNRALTAAAFSGWLTMACLYHSRAILQAANHQYEIRELLIVMLAVAWARQTLQAYRSNEPTT